MRGSEVARALGAWETPPSLFPLRCLSEVGEGGGKFLGLWAVLAKGGCGMRPESLKP